MKFLVGAACIAIIAASGYYLTGEYVKYSAAMARIQDAAVEQRVADSARVSGPECRAYASKAVSDGGFYDTTIKRRLRLCISRDELWPFDRDQLKSARLYEQLVVPN